MDRICREHNKPSENYWHTALVFSMRVDEFEPTELNYMENRLTKKAEESHRYKVLNKVMPSTGYMRYYDEMSNRLDRFLNMGILIMNFTTPYRVFNVKDAELLTHANATLAPNADTIKKKQNKLRLFTANNGAATCTIESSTHVTLLRGSAIRRNSTKRSHNRIERIRLPYKALISSTGNLRQDIVFSSLSRASCFVMGYSCNGHDYWKDADVKTYREVLSSK
jgi:hypothetical protein